MTRWYDHDHNLTTAEWRDRKERRERKRAKKHRQKVTQRAYSSRRAQRTNKH